MKREKKKLVAWILSMTMICAMLPMISVPASAAETTQQHLDGSAYTLEKVSNPTTGQGEIDGLNPLGDRASSYCWAIAENNGYVYIGTWANGLYQEIIAIQQLSQQVGADVSQDIVDKLMLVLSKGQVSPCEEDSYKTAKIYRYCEATGEMELLFDPADYPDSDYGEIYGFRGATTFNGQVYFDAMLNSSATRCQLWRIDESNPTGQPELCLENGSLRAICNSVDDKTMYCGGSCDVPEGYKSGAVIFSTQTGNPNDFQTIADSDDFEYYTKNGTTITVNDVCAFENDTYESGEEIIASLITNFGVTIFRGHQASQAEIDAGTANSYGWVWLEFVGVNGQYPASMGNMLNVTLTPAVFQGELYFMSMTNPMTPMIMTGMGIVSENTQYLYNGIDQMAATLENECSIYRYTKDGQMQMVMGDAKKCPDSITYAATLGAGFNDDEYSTTMYAWRAVTYNDRMYVCTIDVWNMYSYFTTLTNGELLGLNEDEFREELGYVVDLFQSIYQPGTATSALTEIEDTADREQVQAKLADAVDETAFDRLYRIYSTLDKEATTESLSQAINFALENAEDIDSSITELRPLLKMLPESEQITQIIEALDQLQTYTSFIVENKTHLENYMLVSDICANHTTPGGEVWCSTNGTDWEAITETGFEDKFNHGIRTMIKGEDGSLYFGTANPYYGAQLWKMTDIIPEPTPQPSFLDVPEGAYYADAVAWAVENGITNGTSDTTFSPDAEITREQAVMFLWRANGSPKSSIENPYQDVSPNDYSYQAVLWATETGITTGTTDTTFSPYSICTRAQNVVFLWRMNDSPKITGSNPFVDVADNAYYKDAVLWAVENGITNGITATTFAPDKSCTRAQFVTFLYRNIGQ